MADNLALANALLAHDKGTGAVCGMVWLHFGVASPIGKKLDRSAWNGLDLLAHGLHPDSEAPAPTPIAAVAIEQDRAWRKQVAAVGATNASRAWGMQKGPISPLARLIAIAWVEELLRLLAQIDGVLGEEPFSIRVRPPRQIKTWTAVLDHLVAAA